MASFSPFWEKIRKPNAAPPTIAFTDPDDPRIQQAVQIIREQKIAVPLLIKDPPANVRDELAALLVERQKKQAMTLDAAREQLKDPLYHGIALLLSKKVDGLIGGSLRPTADIVRAAIQCVGPAPDYRLISGQFLIETEGHPSSENAPFLFADCAVMPEPSPRALASIAVGAAAAYRFFIGGTPRVAFLSFSTRGSAEHPLVDRIREAVSLVKKQEPGLIADGEIQLDAALDASVARIKRASDSPLAGSANVLIFPTLEAGNIGYKLVQRFAAARIAGPLLWGLARPMSDLSRGCTVQEVTDTAACLSAVIRGKI